MAYEIGEKVWFKGDEITITTGPYNLYGGMFQDGVTSTGKVKSIATREQRGANAQRAQNEWKNQQENFRKLGK